MVGGEWFRLTARLIPPQSGGPLRISIDLRNVSPKDQQIITLTNFFEGRICLRKAGNRIHEFYHRHYVQLLMTGEWMTPTLSLPPGASWHFEHSLDEFVDYQRKSTVKTTNVFGGDFLTLAEEFQPDGELWCALDLLQWHKLKDGRHQAKLKIGTASSVILPPPAWTGSGD